MDIYKLTQRQSGTITILCLCGLFMLSTLVIIKADPESRSLYTNLPETIAAAFALGFSLLVLYQRQKAIFTLSSRGNFNNSGLIDYRKRTIRDNEELLTHIFLTLGIGTWFSAEMVYSYYQLWLNVDTPYPSIADPFYLIGYGFFAFYFYRVLQLSSKGISRDIIVLISFAAALSIGYILNLSFGLAQMVSIQQNILTTTLSIAYPILDTVLLVPAITLLWSIRKGALEHTHWLLISIFMTLATIADVGYGYDAVTGVVSEQEWVWDILYNASYITIAASLFWESKYYSKNRKTIMVDRIMPSNIHHANEDNNKTS